MRGQELEPNCGSNRHASTDCALAKDPEVILMDEPFVSLNVHTRLIMRKERCVSGSLVRKLAFL